MVRLGLECVGLLHRPGAREYCQLQVNAGTNVGARVRLSLADMSVLGSGSLSVAALIMASLAS